MAFNNGFPMNYQPMYQPMAYQQQQPTVPNQQQGNLIWVSGEAGAKAYLVAPNNTVQLWDSEAQTIYLKSADASGMPTMKVLDYTIRNSAPATAPAVQQPVSDYVTRDEFNALAEKLNRLEKEGKHDEQSYGA